MGYDIIGDIHGYAEPLTRLLDKLGYTISDGSYKHHDHTAIFVGDFIDRGPQQKEVIRIVRSMVDSGAAKAIMGNHEYNALAFHTPSRENPDLHLRVHSNKNMEQHLAFLNEYLADPKELRDTLDWFMTLPMWLELDGIRIIHACWDDKHIQFLKKYSPNAMLTEELLHKSSVKGTQEFEAIETLLKGKEIDLPKGEYFHDKMGTRRYAIRCRWWDSTATTYQTAYMGPEEARGEITDAKIDVSHLVDYPSDAPPVFMGHYWLSDEPKPLNANICCTDFSIAKSKGKLAAYRWQGDEVLSKSNFVWVER